jgi:hypothetical protein
VVAQWSMRTAEIQSELAAAAAALDAFACESDRLPLSDVCAWSVDVVRLRWKEKPTSLVQRYEASLAFPTREYVPIRANILMLAKTVRGALRKGTPVSGAP